MTPGWPRQPATPEDTPINPAVSHVQLYLAQPGASNESMIVVDDGWDQVVEKLRGGGWVLFTNDGGPILVNTALVTHARFPKTV